ncbi:hypothetical protein GH714_019995 [Hevea brasiliensis]|uniref:Uncharacterized protein n=1 Tax=Hevea brasiliensis TaxID=3981 RepID=A0A6A6LRD0_HEVBR|nr:hypothetical protein GH714_019995 [Hevea brasiliensis]
MGRPDHRARPNSSPATRHFDDKTPFLSHTAQIGRHFDEDERKPLDGVSAPRRTVNDESFRVPQSRMELKPEPVLSGMLSGSASGVQLQVHTQEGQEGDGSSVNEPVQSCLVRREWRFKDGCSGGREYPDATLARHVEKGMGIDDGIQNGRKEYVDHDRVRAALYSELKERNLSLQGERFQPPRTDVRFSRSELLPLVQSESSERPKVKLLPRTKPLDNLELSTVDHEQGHQQLSNSANGHVKAGEMHGNVSAAKPGLTNLDSANQAIERPKLNLKPRSQPLEQSEGNTKMGRFGLFGGARPREVVLKERGIDSTAIGNHDSGQHPDWVKHIVSKTERVPEHAVPTRHGERNDNFSPDQRAGKKIERKDQQVDIEKVDKQRRNWRNENWRNSRDTERQQQLPQLQRERPPSPETWRKPVEQPKPTSPDAAGLRYGKAASALELAQAFSRSFSDPKTADQYSGQRSLTGKTQMPFSRLMGPTARPQINGY